CAAGHSGGGVVAAGYASGPPFFPTPSFPRSATASCPGGESCNDSCTGCAVQCGDGVVGAPEVCDPPFSPAGCPAGESCNAICTGCAVQCGDRVVGAPEVCDPPFSPAGCPAGESCNATCTGCAVHCGDAVVGAGETCDPPFSPAGCPAGESCNDSCTGCAVTSGRSWTPFAFQSAVVQTPCTGARYVRYLPNYGKWIGVSLCSAVRYKLFLGQTRN